MRSPAWTAACSTATNLSVRTAEDRSIFGFVLIKSPTVVGQLSLIVPHSCAWVAVPPVDCGRRPPPHLLPHLERFVISRSGRRQFRRSEERRVGKERRFRLSAEA